ncbi:hypothetical protein GCM10007907_17780 [Chitinimonas prasina]|uniref:Knr4/Smi1-like domain-containing protein n=1 Tax=Chitinimonas prasina TaxID=1434937 RepID=A0ABQ5YES2_9NEIS|nr:SMI1/KNR4 family protein [Chitinimonas prasina]GLR12988.1 hypothetical protein GCM10007907_17780 [Chitinimonas prasina]
MNFERLNINIGGLPSLGFQGADGVFDQVAALVGAPLPESYLKLIRTADGGHPEVGCFLIPGGNDGNLFEVDHFYAFSNSAAESILDALDKWRGIGDGTLPIGRDGGGNQIFLDMSTGGGVWIILHDENMLKIKIAESFEEFIHGLRLNPDFI